GKLSRPEAGLHDGADDRVSPGEEGSRAPRPQGGQRAHLRADRRARGDAASAARRHPQPVRRPRPADDGAARRSRQADPPGRAGARENDRSVGKAAQSGEVTMMSSSNSIGRLATQLPAQLADSLAGPLAGQLIAHVWQSTLFAAALALLTLAFRQNE